MGFFSLLETFFFLSLGITFVLIIMLVYHFKGRLVALEEKYHTMFDIMNSMVKEMKNLRDTMIAIQYQAPVQIQEQSAPSFPIDFMKMFQGGGPQLFPSQRQYDDDDDDDDDEEQEYKKIVVSDTELDSDDEDDDTDVKIISVDIGEAEESVSLADLDEDENLVNQLDAEEQEQEQEEDKQEDQGEPQEEPQEDQDEEKQENQEPMDLKKMDVSYLRTMVLTRGLATDTKRMKKNDLIKLLEQTTESNE